MWNACKHIRRRVVWRVHMHAEHPITAASRRRQAQPCVACSPCTCSSVGCARRWRRPRSPHTHSSLGGARRWRRPRSPRICSSLGGARRWRRPRSPRTDSCVGHAGVSSAAVSSWPSSPCSASPAPLLPACRSPIDPAPSALAPLLAMPTLVLSPTSASIASARSVSRREVECTRVSTWSASCERTALSPNCVCPNLAADIWLRECSGFEVFDQLRNVVLVEPNCAPCGEILLQRQVAEAICHGYVVNLREQSSHALFKQKMADVGRGFFLLTNSSREYSRYDVVYCYSIQ